MTDFEQRYERNVAKTIIKKYKLKAGISDKEIDDAIYLYAFNNSDGPGDYYATMNISDNLRVLIKQLLNETKSHAKVTMPKVNVSLNHKTTKRIINKI